MKSLFALAMLAVLPLPLFAQDAEAEVNRMKAQEKERQSEAEDNANQRYLYPDGTVKTSLSNEEIAQMQREVEQKAAVIRDRAKKRAADLR